MFCLEVNRLLGRALQGPSRNRKRAMYDAEARLLLHVRAPVHTSYVTLPSGLRLYTIVVGKGDARAKRRNPIVLLHGHSMGGAMFFRNFDDLLQMGYSAVYTLDLPGWARSSRPRFRGHRDTCPVDFFLGPFSQWLHQLDLTRFTLLGHSLGAYLAHEFAIGHPHAVSRLILTAPAAVTRRTPFAQAAWFSLTPQRFLTCGGLIAHLLFTSKYPRAAAYNVHGFRQFTFFANSTAHRSGDAAAAAILRLYRHGVFAWRWECVRPLVECVIPLSCPVHIVAGECDQLVDVGNIRLLYRAMRAVGNNVALSVLPDADHSPHIVAPFLFAKTLMRQEAALA